MRAVILDNLRSAYNVGSIMRSALALGYDEVALCGVSILPPAPKLMKTSRGADRKLTWKGYLKTPDAINRLRERGFAIHALESGQDAQPVGAQPRPEHLAWVVGNEAHGLGEEILALCDRIETLPMRPGLDSINVACAFTAAAYLDLQSR
ncbi:MAG: TrmH family RNA methyltransferase [Planctomycetes bacterium]|nr:TrmH family RNA methyltransferase [Planctomycetota bacterium]